MEAELRTDDGAPAGLRIGALGAAAGVDVETIRYYERIGVLPAPARSANGYRSYGPAHLERLAFIRHCRALDMPLDEIRRLLALVDGGMPDHRDIDTLVDRQLGRVRARLASLRALERQLVALRARCDGDDASGCGILDELVGAAHGEACACHPPPVRSSGVAAPSPPAASRSTSRSTRVPRKRPTSAA